MYFYDKAYDIYEYFILLCLSIAYSLETTINELTTNKQTNKRKYANTNIPHHQPPNFINIKSENCRFYAAHPLIDDNISDQKNKTKR